MGGAYPYSTCSFVQAGSHKGTRTTRWHTTNTDNEPEQRNGLHFLHEFAGMLQAGRQAGKQASRQAGRQAGRQKGWARLVDLFNPFQRLPPSPTPEQNQKTREAPGRRGGQKNNLTQKTKPKRWDETREHGHAISQHASCRQRTRQGQGLNKQQQQTKQKKTPKRSEIEE